MDHLATTTSTGASRRRAAIIAPPSLEPGKPCCGRQSESRRAKAQEDQRTRTTIAADEEKSRIEGSNLKTQEHILTKARSMWIHRRQTSTKSRDIRQRHISTCPPMVLDAPPERGLDTSPGFYSGQLWGNHVGSRDWGWHRC